MLVRGGGPHDENREPVIRYRGADWTYHGIKGFSTDGAGRALCACGELSEPLPSRQKRRLWQREHKAANA